MKKSFLIIAFMLAAVTFLKGQIPGTFNYQAIARNSQGTLLSDRDLPVRIGILKGESLVWQEDHVVHTNDLGLFQLKIGDPAATNHSGSAVSFGEIPWGDGGLQLQVSVDDGNGFTVLGTSEFQSVPYALFAMDGPGGSGTPGPDVWSKNGDTLTTMNYVGIGTSTPNQSTLTVQGLSVQPEAPLFEVRREDGFPVFAVYSDGVMVYVDENSKSRKRGLTVGSPGSTMLIMTGALLSEARGKAGVQSTWS